MAQAQLVPADDNPIKDLTQVSEAMKLFISQENDAVLQMAIDRMNQQPSLWRRWFPDAFDREQAKITLDRVRSAYAAKKQFLDAYVSVQLEITRRRGDALIAAVGMDLQAKLAAFAKAKSDELTQTIIQGKDEFYANIATHIRSLEQYKDIPGLYERAKQSADRQITQYVEWVEGLCEGFTNALKAKVSGKA